MNQLKLSLLALIFAIFFLGCASSYKSIKPHTLAYRNIEISDAIDYAYKFDVIAERGNKKYAKKENKHDVDIIAIKIENKTDRALVVANDIVFRLNGLNMMPMESSSVTTRIKQGVIGYALYGLLFLYVNDGESTNTYPIGVPIALGNMLMAAASNKKFKDEFEENNILEKTIQPGETVHGLVAFRDISFGRLEILLK